MPELLISISAVGAADAPNIALGNCVFNLAVLVLFEELSHDPPTYRRIDQGHTFDTEFRVILIAPFSQSRLSC